MQNELNDSLLSAYLDDQLTGEERAAVEAKLRESAEHRQALAELRQLRESFQALPRYELGDDFSNRVVEAALAAAQQETQDQNTANESARMPGVSAATPFERAPASRTTRRLAYAAGTLAAVAACWLVVVQMGGDFFSTPRGDQPDNGPSVAVTEPETPQEPAAVVALRQSLPGQGEALVVRVRVPAGVHPSVALDAALAQSGISQVTPSESTPAGRVGAAYRTALREKGAAPAAAAGQAPADALYVEAPLALVEDALAVLADQEGGRLELRPEMKVAVAKLPGSTAVGEGEGEGEGGSKSETTAQAQPFAQRLNPRIFRLPTEATTTVDAESTEAKTVDPNQKVRVLILVETVK